MSLKTLGLSIVIGSVFTGTKAFASSSHAVTKLDASLKKLNDYKTTLKVDSKEFAIALKQTQLLDGAINKLKKNASKLDEINAGREKFRSRIMDTAAMGAVAITPIKMAADFETSFVGIQKVVDFNNDAEIKKMKKDILDMSTTLPVSAAGLSEIAASMGGIGIAKKDILGATKAVAIMSTAFDMSADAAGDSMGKLMNVYGLSVKEVMAVGDTINAVDAGTAAKAKLTVEVLGRIGGTAKAMGMSAHSAAGLAGAFLDLGVAPEVAGTGINALLSKMMTADKQGAKFQSGLKAIGMSADGMKEAISKDASGAVNGLINSLAKLPKEDRMGVLVDMFGAEYADDIALVVGGIDRYNKATSIAADTTKNAGSMQEEFDKQSETTANQMKLLSGSITAIGINIGTVLLPGVSLLAGYLKRGTDVIGGFASRNETATTVIGGLAVGVIGGAVALSVFGYAASFVTGGLIRLSTAYTIAILRAKTFALWIRTGGVRLFFKSAVTKIATAATWLYSTALKAGRLSLMIFGGAASFAGRAILWMGRALLMNPIGLAVTAIAGAAYLIYKNWGAIKTWFSNLWSGIKSTVSTAWDSFKPIFAWTPMGLIVNNWGAIKGFFSGLWSGVKSSVSSIWEGIKSLFSWHPLALIANNWTPITGFFTSIISKIKQPFSEFFGWIEGKFKTVSGLISDVGSFFGIEAPKPVPVAARATAATPKPATIPARAPANTSQPQRTTGPIKPQIASVPPRKPSAPINNVTVNITNPRFDSKEEAAAIRKQIAKEVETAMKKMANDKKDRSYS